MHGLPIVAGRPFGVKVPWALMMRRSFRFGLRVGLLGGITAAVVKALQARRSSSSPAVVEEPATWPPIQAVPSPPQPEVPDVQAEVDTPPPVKKAAKKVPAPKKAPASKPAKKSAAPAVAAWVEPVGAVCPPSHPVKAKLKSRLYHLPGMFAYARAVPDRCYATPEQAEADGLNRAKR
jgi:outer membrane biosynthesis protein TonB